jgi:small subunit ribosomal protein S6|tara:strand:+ start:281 stop:634 length:354 start_codon:yes stop_codon:yes gene_type:complete
MNLYEHTIIVKQNHSDKQLKSLKEKYSKIIEKNEGEIIKIDDWGLLNLSHEIDKNKRGNYIHFKLKGCGLTVSELEKNEKIDSSLLRFLTVRVKKFNLNNNYFKQRNVATEEVKKKT